MNLPRALTEVPDWDEPKFEDPPAVGADSDGDGVIDPWDCQPLNPLEQGWFDDKVRSFARRTGQRIMQGSQRVASRYASPSQRRQSMQHSNQRRKQQKRTRQKRTQQRSSGRGTTWAPRHVHYIGRGYPGLRMMTAAESRAYRAANRRR